MNFINKYLNQSAYDADDTKQYPNTSLVANDVVYAMTAPVFGGLTVVYNIVDASQEVTLFNGGGSSSSSGGESESESGGGGALPTTMIVDGVSETPINTWRFESTGEHIVQYEFQDDAVPEMFLYVEYVTDVTVGTDIVEIGSFAFNSPQMTSATILPTTPPSLADVQAFGGSGANYPIFVPSEAVNTYKAATTWSSLSSRIYAIGTDLEHAENPND